MRPPTKGVLFTATKSIPPSARDRVRRTSSNSGVTWQSFTRSCSNSYPSRSRRFCTLSRPDVDPQLTLRWQVGDLHAGWEAVWVPLYGQHPAEVLGHRLAFPPAKSRAIWSTTACCCRTFSRSRLMDCSCSDCACASCSLRRLSAWTWAAMACVERLASARAKADEGRLAIGGDAPGGHLPVAVAAPRPGVLGQRGAGIAVTAEKLGDLGFESGLHQQLGPEAGHLRQDLWKRPVLGDQLINVVANTDSRRYSEHVWAWVLPSLTWSSRRGTYARRLIYTGSWTRPTMRGWPSLSSGMPTLEVPVRPTFPLVSSVPARHGRRADVATVVPPVSRSPRKVAYSTVGARMGTRSAQRCSQPLQMACLRVA